MARSKMRGAAIGWLLPFKEKFRCFVSVTLQVGEGSHGLETPSEQRRPEDKLLDGLQEGR